MNSKPIVFSGIQPTGNLHVGNYLGAVRNWVDLQNSGEYDCYFCIVDYHALTGSMGADQRREQITRTAVELLALGIDPKKSTLFVQSHVPAHTELAWIFNTITPVAELYRMTQFKDKSAGKEAGNINSGLLTYPILMAADILLYQAGLVPVGKDQIQHLELTRVIARLFNKRYGDVFAEVKPLLTKVPKVMSLLEPEKKMSKSLGEGHVIELQDSPEVIEKKLKKAVTATQGGGVAPGVENLFTLLREFGDKKLLADFQQAEKNGSIRYGDLKGAVAEALSTYFVQFRERRTELLADPNKVGTLLARGAKQAQKTAETTMQKVRQMVGIR